MPEFSERVRAGGLPEKPAVGEGCEELNDRTTSTYELQNQYDQREQKQDVNIRSKHMETDESQ
jgi:hypothetical protein